MSRGSDGNPASRDWQTLIEGIPYARLIGLECLPIGEQFIFKLPQNEDNLGNPTLPALHGGVIGGFMEASATLHLMLSGAGDGDATPRIIDFSLDYLRPGRHRNSFCQCTIIRQGRKIANVSIDCWQTTRDEPIAVARAHFLLARPDPQGDGADSR